LERDALIPPSDSRSILVVGGTSFIGRHLLPRLVASRARVTATCRAAAARPAIAGVEWLETDLTADHPAAHWPSRCDAVIYLAQSHEWRQFPAGATDVFDVNLRGVFRAAEYSRAAGADRFIFASTGSVYGEAESTIERQAFDIATPRHFYVAAKLSAELLLASYAALMHVVVLRLFVPYGAAQDPGMLMPQILRRVRDGEPVYLDGADGLRANPVAAGDVAEAFARCLDLDASATLNVAGPESLTLREIATRMGEAVGRAPRFEPRDGVPANLVGDVAALSAALGWTPQVTVAEGLRQWLASPDSGRPARL
jgi:nucleoside-diphosphate-sugar epimerase